MLIDNSESIANIRSITTDAFADFVGRRTADDQIVDYVLDVCDYNARYSVNAYVKMEDDSVHLLSFTRVSGVEDVGAVVLNSMETNILKSL